MPRNPLGFNDNFLESGEEDMEDSATKGIDESRTGEEWVMTNQSGKKM
jgi:hypothetical protein